MGKIFIVGLPRTGTTSVCASMLDLGYAVAHTAYSQETFRLADVVADTPVYNDYALLDQLFDQSKFIYLERDLDRWAPSVQRLLYKIAKRTERNGDVFHPVLRRCIASVFGQLNDENTYSLKHLEACYLRHKREVFECFAGRENDLISINVSDPAAYGRMLKFLEKGIGLSSKQVFPHLNGDGSIAAWQKIKHHNKINSNAFGENRRQYFDVKK